MNWSEVESCTDVNEAWTKFKCKFMSALDIMAPFKEVRLKQRTEPWMSSEILDFSRNRVSEQGQGLKIKVIMVKIFIITTNLQKM